jgi:hypothetical protein
VLLIEPFPDYEPRLAAVMNRLRSYRPDAGIDWRSRVESWLSNFGGLHDQRIALEMLERLRVVPDAEVVEACRALLEAIRSVPRGDDTRIFHTAHETSGGLLLRLLEKQLKVRSFEILRPSDFASLKSIKKVRMGDTVVIWDRFNGTGNQLLRLAGRYTKDFENSGKGLGSLRLAYIAGHALEAVLPRGVHLHLWLDDIPTVSPEEADLCTRYAEAAGGTETNQSYETGALITFADNPPNNVPLVLRAAPKEGWFSLLDRKETPRP